MPKKKPTNPKRCRCCPALAMAQTLAGAVADAMARTAPRRRPITAMQQQATTAQLRREMQGMQEART